MLLKIIVQVRLKESRWTEPTHDDQMMVNESRLLKEKKCRKNQRKNERKKFNMILYSFEKKLQGLIVKMNSFGDICVTRSVPYRLVK